MKTATELVCKALKDTGVSKSELARFMGWSRQKLHFHLKDNSLSYDECAKAMEYLGYELKVFDANGSEISR